MTSIEKAINKASDLLAKREDENEYHLHDVDRKWVIEAMMDYAEYILSMSEKPTQQELSDEEIEKFANEKYAESKKLFSTNHFPLSDLENHFIDGMKCYREQIS
jgi:hypothetical protein